MNRNTRKGLGAILAGVGMTTLLGVMTGLGPVRADVDDQDIPAGFDDAPTEAEVTMKERCIWYVSGVPSAITLTAADSEDDEVYDGDQYSLSASLLDYVAWTSGNTTGGEDDEGEIDADSHAPCTFFGEETGIEVDGTWDGVGFDAEAQDIDVDGLVTDVDDSMNMGFDADGTDPLTLNLTTGTCRAFGTWSVGPSIAAPSSASILNLPATGATERPDDAAGSNDKCNAVASVTASIPAGKTPLYAGKAYKFTGPTLTTEINIDSSR
jgi:hypothetical protein